MDLRRGPRSAGPRAYRQERARPGRATLSRLIEDFPGAEDTRKQGAEKETAWLKGRVAEQQKPRVAELAASGKIKTIGKLERGQTDWKADEGPYLVTSVLQVESGDLLRIEAGTLVRFTGEGGLQVASGRLEAVGTAEKPVQFLPLSDDPGMDYWLGIGAKSGAGETACRMAYCQVRGADPGFRLNDGQAELDHCVFDRCGRFSVRTGRIAGLTMTGCKITGGYRVGIECDPQSLPRLSDCRVSALTTDGIVLHYVADAAAFDHCIIEGCGGDGIRVRGEGGPKSKTARSARTPGGSPRHRRGLFQYH